MIRLHLNESPYQIPPEMLARALEAGRRSLNLYPDPGNAELRDRYAAYAAVGPNPAPVPLTREQVIPTNGGDEAIDLAVMALGPLVRQVVVMPPTFGEYARAARVAGLDVVEVPLTPDYRMDLDRAVETARRRSSLVFVCNPNNPTSNRIAGSSEIVSLATARPDTWVVIDEAYWEFAGETLLPLITSLPNVIIVRTMSKAFCLAGLRLGFALTSAETARRLEKARMLFNVNAFTAAVGSAALAEPAYMRDAVSRILEGRRRLTDGLAATPGMAPYPSLTNFVFSRTPRPAADIARAMADRGVLVRTYPNDPGLTHRLRISVGTPDDIDRCLAVLGEVL